MRILHLFDRYLNTTMNWAYQLIRHTPDIDAEIAAPLFIRNQFLDPDFTYWYAPWIQDEPPTEWNISVIQKLQTHFYFQKWGRYQKFLFRKLHPDPPDILHAHFANVAWHYSSLARKLRRPFVISFYGYDYERLLYYKPEFKRYYQQLFQEATAFICEGTHGAEQLIRQGCPREKIQVIHLGIQPEQVPFWERKKKKGELHMLQAATYTEKKGHRYTLEAFKKTLADCPDLQLTLIGEAVDKDIYQWVRNFVQVHQLDERVRFMDFLPYSDFYQKMNDFHLFIHPSCYAKDRDCEGGAPVVFLDVQAGGMPVLSTRHCDIPSEVIHGKTGWLCEEKNVDCLSQGIRAFYEMDTATYSTYQQQARAHVTTHYDIAESGRQLRALYQKIKKG
jgi:colanic acid/amylovoran biosynthesis glycosyltransferase